MKNSSEFETYFYPSKDTKQRDVLYIRCPKWLKGKEATIYPEDNGEGLKKLLIFHKEPIRLRSI